MSIEKQAYALLNQKNFEDAATTVASAISRFFELPSKWLDGVINHLTDNKDQTARRVAVRVQEMGGMRLQPALAAQGPQAPAPR